MDSPLSGTWLSGEWPHPSAQGLLSLDLGESG